MSAVVPPDATVIEPFWNRIPAMLRYAARGSALVTVIALGLAHILALIPLGFVWVLLVTVAMYRYGFDCLLATADGRMDPPEVSVTDDSGLGWRLVGMIFLIIFFLVLCATFLGKGAAVVAALLVAFALPGAIITLALEQGVFRALNPGKWLALITRIGWPYLAAFGLFLVVLFSEGYAAALVQRFMPRAAAIVVAAIIANYALVVTFHLLGYLVYQYHGALGVESAGTQAYAPLAAPDPDQDVLDEAAGLVQAGDPAQATALLRSHLRGRGGTPKVHQQYRKLLRLANDTQGLLAHGHEYLNVLLGQGNDHAALMLVRECQALDPQFAPAQAEQLTRLAQLAARGGDPKLALRLVTGFERRFPASADIVANGLLAATLVHEHLNQDAQARDMLLDLKAKHPHTPLLPQIDERLALIDRMLEGARRLAPKPPAPDSTAP